MRAGRQSGIGNSINRRGVAGRREMAPDAATGTMEVVVRAGAKAYDRARDLPALIRWLPVAGQPEAPETLAAIVARLERALRAERSRARAGHWTYDLNRHIALCQAFRAETQRLAAADRQAATAKPNEIKSGQGALR